jgi:lipopolysaccharide biosynthesis protein
LIGSILDRAHLPKIEISEIAEFAAGSMAWFRSSVFRPLVGSFGTLQEFEPEEGQIDTTLAHLMNPLIFAGTHIGQISWTNDSDREFHPSEAWP